MLKVLLVDDEPDMLELLSARFTAADFNVHTASNGIEALHQARRVLPDLIILDLLLPDLDGISVCEILRRQPSTAAIPVIMLTAVSGQLCRLACLEAGADCYLSKPTAPKDLLNRARSLIEERREPKMDIEILPRLGTPQSGGWN